MMKLQKLLGMRSPKRLLAGVLGALCLSSAAFAGQAGSVTITHVLIGPVFGNMIFVSVSGAVAGPPACSDNTAWSFVLPLTTPLENQMLAILLTAQATKSTVTITGTGQCDVYNNVETLQKIQL